MSQLNRGGQAAVFALAALALALLFAPAAGAAFPGENGKIAFSGFTSLTSRDDIYVIDPSGSGRAQLTSTAAQDRDPAWSPDGAKIAFRRFENGDWDLFVMDATGANPIRLTDTTENEGAPHWFPDGTKLLFARDDAVFTINPDGTGTAPVPISRSGPVSPNGARVAYSADAGFPQDFNIETVLLNGTGVTGVTQLDFDEFEPSWAPSGQKLSFTYSHFDPIEEAYVDDIYFVDADGNNVVPLVESASLEPITSAFSPDGSKVALELPVAGSQTAIHTVNADGSGVPARITTGTVSESDPDWQPVLRGYPRPQGALSLRVPLVSAFTVCAPGSANRTHGPSLTHPSCSPEVEQSPNVTIGTRDANGKEARSNMQVKVNVCNDGTTPGDICSTPAGMTGADVRLEASATDIRDATTLLDYTGELQTRVTLRITDRNNTPHPGGPGPATVTDVPLAFTVACSPTVGGIDIGSSCGSVTNANALAPGAVVAGRRAIWELSQIELLDGGPDGDAETANNSVFARQGVFVP